jgi:tRNA A37 methylthiotransferase MiaB
MGAAGVGASLAYLPHSAGLLQAYVQKHIPDPDRYAFLTPLYRRLRVAEAVAHMGAADVVGFSAYVWNIRLSLRIAEALKARRPETLVIFGGPQVPDDAEAFLREHPYVDLACHGEGERTFLEVLERRFDRCWEAVESVSFIGRDDRYVQNRRRERIRELDEVPSPLLEGTYENLMRSNPGQSWLLTWETNRGCPFSCTFCDWGSATGSKVFRYGMDRLALEIKWMVDHGIHHLVVCDANFGMFTRDVDIAQMLADEFARGRSPLSVSTQNTKNRTERSEAIQRIFRDSRVISFGASISLQSVDPSVLKAIRRDNISSEAFERLQRHYAREGLDTYTDLIIGLPGETYDSFTDGIDRVIRNGQLNRVAFYDCTILPNAPMAEPGYREAHGLETIPVPLIHAHQPLDRFREDEAPETIDVVVSTRMLDREEWVRAVVFANLVELLFFDRLLHLVMVILSEGYGLSYRRMIEAFLDAEESAFPTVASAVRRLEEHAKNIQRGGTPQMAAPEWLCLWWPADQHTVIRFARERLFDSFYEEATALLAQCAKADGVPVDPVLLTDAVQLNHAMFALPFQWKDKVIKLSFPVATAYQSILSGQKADLDRRPETILVQRSGTVWVKWDDWYEDLVRRVFLRKNYLYPIRIIDAPELPGYSTRELATLSAAKPV